MESLLLLRASSVALVLCPLLFGVVLLRRLLSWLNLSCAWLSVKGDLRENVL